VAGVDLWFLPQKPQICGFWGRQPDRWH